MKIRKLFLSVALLAGLVTSSFAAHHGGGGSVFTRTFLGTYGNETDKLISLAEAFSDEGMNWRPAEGIRSVRESILHVAAANYFIGSRLGAEMPSGLNPGEFVSTITSKEDTIKTLKDSIAFI